MTIRKYDLIKIIKKDFILYGKIYFFLFIIIIFTSICLVMTVHQTRLLTIQEENLILKKKKTNEWRNLIIEKNTAPFDLKIKKE